jgi:hypothetical protein
MGPISFREWCGRHREVAPARIAPLLALDDIDDLDIPGPGFREDGLAMNGMDAGGALDLQDLRVDLPAALMESHLDERSEVQRRNRDLEQAARRARAQGGLADELGIVDRPDDRIIRRSREHAIDFGVQLPRNPFAVSGEQVLSFCRRNSIAVEDAVPVLCELSAQSGVL